MSDVGFLIAYTLLMVVLFMVMLFLIWADEQ